MRAIDEIRSAYSAGVGRAVAGLGDLVGETRHIVLIIHRRQIAAGREDRGMVANGLLEGIVVAEVTVYFVAETPVAQRRD